MLSKVFNKIYDKINQMSIVKINKIMKINYSILISLIHNNLLIININFTIKNKIFIIINNMIINQIDNTFYKTILS